MSSSCMSSSMSKRHACLVPCLKDTHELDMHELVMALTEAIQSSKVIQSMTVSHKENWLRGPRRQGHCPMELKQQITK